MKHKFPYKWTLKEAFFSKDKGKVFSCFACGGGSTLGYKLAGFDVIGCNEIDERLNTIYVANHSPKYNYLCDIRDLVSQAKEHSLPDELYNLDILDGSPPCSVFSMMGNRELDWGRARVFKEGQKKQVLDNLFFEFIALARELRPKIVIAENVKGLVQGKAKRYVTRIHQAFNNAGYYSIHFLLDASVMGVPQKRERVFFLAIRKDIADSSDIKVNDGTPEIDMTFSEKPITFRSIRNDSEGGKELSAYKRMLWDNKKPGDHDCGDVTRRIYGNEKCFTDSFVFDNKVLKTVNTSALNLFMLWDIPRRLNASEVIAASTFPTDFQFGKSVAFICGMCVPPVMMAQVADRVYEYWLKRLQ